MSVEVPNGAPCLFLDVDGSLIDIAPRPEAVVVPPGLVDDLAELSRGLEGAVALVSGRTVAEIDRLFAPLRLAASGVHGAEWRLRPEDGMQSVASGPLPRALWNAVDEVVRRFPGSFAEDKAYSFAVHYRASPAAGPAIGEALAALLREHPRLKLMPGHKVFEIKGGDFDKGAAVRRFLAAPPFAGRRPVFVGDDVTDRPGFAAALQAGGLAYGVGADIPGTSGTFASPSAVRQWLAQVAATHRVDA